MRGRILAPMALAAALLGGCKKEPRDPPPAIVWHTLADGEALARREHQPALVFFTAQWSVADKELYHRSFPDPEVREALRGWVAIVVDCTDESPASERAKDRFRSLGVPTMLGIDFDDAAQPEELLRLDAFVPPKELAAQIRGASEAFRARSRRAAPR